MNSTTKSRMSLLVLLLSILCPLSAWSSDEVELGCLSGDCEGGFGTLQEQDERGLVRYQGNFLNGKYHGYGKLELLSKNVTYKGRFVQGIKSGRGTEWDDEGRVYIGQWKNDKRNGNGIQAYHFDEWEEDKYSETWLSENTENYYGNFKNDTIDGEGTYRWADGVQYTGSWAASKKHGKGYFLYSSGVKSDRVYNFDERVYGELLPH